MTRTGRTVYRVRWLPGTNRLLGTCHCGATREGSDPIKLWTWLLGHPYGHQPLPPARKPS
ncbi:hypothetical protein [Streptomyces sp. NPDC051776]|uniref:hypothetical protein n=1 Tax=Streptomyces sp. NPDC051776 TaxID=3155414 RepID=UPI0034302222